MKEEEEDNDDDDEKEASDGKIKKNIWRQFLTHIGSIVVVFDSRRRNDTFSDVLWSFINITQPHQTMHEMSELTRQRNCASTFTHSLTQSLTHSFKFVYRYQNGYRPLFGWQTEYTKQLVLFGQRWSELSNCYCETINKRRALAIQNATNKCLWKKTTHVWI